MTAPFQLIARIRKDPMHPLNSSDVALKVEKTHLGNGARIIRTINAGRPVGSCDLHASQAYQVPELDVKNDEEALRAAQEIDYTVIAEPLLREMLQAGRDVAITTQDNFTHGYIVRSPIGLSPESDQFDYGVFKKIVEKLLEQASAEPGTTVEAYAVCDALQSYCECFDLVKAASLYEKEIESAQAFMRSRDAALRKAVREYYAVTHPATKHGGGKGGNGNEKKQQTSVVDSKPKPTGVPISGPSRRPLHLKSTSASTGGPSTTAPSRPVGGGTGAAGGNAGLSSDKIGKGRPGTNPGKDAKHTAMLAPSSAPLSDSYIMFPPELRAILNAISKQMLMECKCCLLKKLPLKRYEAAFPEACVDVLDFFKVGEGIPLALYERCIVPRFDFADPRTNKRRHINATEIGAWQDQTLEAFPIFSVEDARKLVDRVFFCCPSGLAPNGNRIYSMSINITLVLRRPTPMKHASQDGGGEGSSSTSSKSSNNSKSSNKSSNESSSKSSSSSGLNAHTSPASKPGPTPIRKPQQPLSGESPLSGSNRPTSASSPQPTTMATLHSTSNPTRTRSARSSLQSSSLRSASKSSHSSSPTPTTSAPRSTTPSSSTSQTLATASSTPQTPPSPSRSLNMVLTLEARRLKEVTVDTDARAPLCGMGPVKRTLAQRQYEEERKQQHKQQQKQDQKQEQKQQQQRPQQLHKQQQQQQPVSDSTVSLPHANSSPRIHVGVLPCSNIDDPLVGSGTVAYSWDSYAPNSDFGRVLRRMKCTKGSYIRTCNMTRGPALSGWADRHVYRGTRGLQFGFLKNVVTTVLYSLTTPHTTPVFFVVDVDPSRNSSDVLYALSTSFIEQKVAVPNTIFTTVHRWFSDLVDVSKAKLMAAVGVMKQGSSLKTSGKKGGNNECLLFFKSERRRPRRPVRRFDHWHTVFTDKKKGGADGEDDVSTSRHANGFEESATSNALEAGQKMEQSTSTTAACEPDAFSAPDLVPLHAGYATTLSTSARTCLRSAFIDPQTILVLERMASSVVPPMAEQTGLVLGNWSLLENAATLHAFGRNEQEAVQVWGEYVEDERWD